MPGTAELKSLFARKDSAAGISSSTELWPALTLPTAKIENGAGAWVSQSASAAAIFIGCCLNMTLASESPVRAVPRPKTTARTRPRRSEVRIAAVRFGSAPSSRRLVLQRWKEAMPTTNAAPVRKAAVRVCRTTTTEVSWNSTRAMSLSWAFPVTGLIS